MLGRTEQTGPPRFVCSAVADMTIVAGAPRFSARVALVEDVVRHHHYVMTQGPLPVGAKVELTMGTGQHVRATVARCAHHGWGIFRVGVRFDGAAAI